MSNSDEDVLLIPGDGFIDITLDIDETAIELNYNILKLLCLVGCIFFSFTVAVISAKKWLRTNNSEQLQTSIKDIYIILISSFEFVSVLCGLGIYNLVWHPPRDLQFACGLVSLVYNTMAMASSYVHVFYMSKHHLTLMYPLSALERRNNVRHTRLFLIYCCLLSAAVSFIIEHCALTKHKIDSAEACELLVANLSHDPFINAYTLMFQIVLPIVVILQLYKSSKSELQSLLQRAGGCGGVIEMETASQAKKREDNINSNLSKMKSFATLIFTFFVMKLANCLLFVVLRSYFAGHLRTSLLYLILLTSSVYFCFIFILNFFLNRGFRKQLKAVILKIFSTSFGWKKCFVLASLALVYTILVLLCLYVALKIIILLTK